jgi:SAM-dependent methyltransferase
MTTASSENASCGCCGQVSNRAVAFFKADNSQFTVATSSRRDDSPGWNLSYCAICGVLSVDPLPSEGELNRIYEGSFYSNDICRGGIGDWMMQKPLDVGQNESGGKWKKWKLARAAKRDLARVREMAEPLKASGKSIRFLDIGCGTGETLTAAAKLGWDASGIELSPSAAAIARVKSGRPVFNGPFEDFAATGGEYDIIHLGDVLEHLRKPHHLIKWAHDKLAPGGILRIQVPNDLAGYRTKWFSRIWWMFPPIHLHYFTPASLSGLLQRFGFSVVRTGSNGESVGMDTRRTILWSLGLLGRADARATVGGWQSVPFEFLRICWDRILSVPLQASVARSMGGFVFWVSAQKTERAPE